MCGTTLSFGNISTLPSIWFVQSFKRIFEPRSPDFIFLMPHRLLTLRRSWGRSTRGRPTSSTGSLIRSHPTQKTDGDNDEAQVILNNALDNEKGTTDIQSALMYFDSITKYMQQLRTALEELRDDIEWDSTLWCRLLSFKFLGMLLKMNSMQLIMRRESALPSCPLSGFQ